MSLYTYSGPVTEFGRCIVNNWEGQTYAPSKAKAKSNLIYQFKKANNRLPQSKIELPGTITSVTERRETWKN
jgi:hypothetical protein